MGMLDNLRNRFKGSKDAQIADIKNKRQAEEYEKSMLATQIVNLIGQIKKINSFDSSIWNLSNTSTDALKRKSVEELEKLQQSLSRRQQQLIQQSQRENPRSEALEEAKWTGQKPKHLTDAEFDRWQRDDR